MTDQQESFDQNRVNQVYTWLQEVQALPFEAYDDDEKRQVVDDMLESFVVNATEGVAQSEKVRKSRTTIALGQVAYMTCYISGASEDDLIQEMKKRQWSLGQSVDAVAKKTIKSYGTLFHLARRTGGETTQPNATDNQAEAVSGEVIVASERLDAVIFDLIERNAIPKSFGGYYRLLFGTVTAPSTISDNVVATAKAQARELLRTRVIKTNLEIVEDSSLKQGVLGIQKMVRGMDIAVVVKLQTKKHEESESELLHSIALALESLYQSDIPTAQ